MLSRTTKAQQTRVWIHLSVGICGYSTNKWRTGKYQILYTNRCYVIISLSLPKWLAHEYANAAAWYQPLVQFLQCGHQWHLDWVSEISEVAECVEVLIQRSGRHNTIFTDWEYRHSQYWLFGKLRSTKDISKATLYLLDQIYARTEAYDDLWVWLLNRWCVYWLSINLNDTYTRTRVKCFRLRRSTPTKPRDDGTQNWSNNIHRHLGDIHRHSIDLGYHHNFRTLSSTVYVFFWRCRL
jgi:hypothetical protein